VYEQQYSKYYDNYEKTRLPRSASSTLWCPWWIGSFRGGNCTNPLHCAFAHQCNHTYWLETTANSNRIREGLDIPKLTLSRDKLQPIDRDCLYHQCKTQHLYSQLQVIIIKSARWLLFDFEQKVHKKRVCFAYDWLLGLWLGLTAKPPFLPPNNSCFIIGSSYNTHGDKHKQKHKHN